MKKELKQKFVTMIRSGYTKEQAAMGIGYPKAAAKEFSRILLEDPEVQQMLEAPFESRWAREEEITVEAVIRQIMFDEDAKPAVRLAAASRLATIYNMDGSHQIADVQPVINLTINKE